MKRIVQTLSFAALLGTSVAASATIIEVKYEGFVTGVDANIPSYSLGDSISGSLFINTDVAPGEYCVTDPLTPECAPSPKVATYSNGFGLGDDSNFITGMAPNDTYSQDWVYLLDDTGTGGLGDDFQVGEDEFSWYDDGVNNWGGKDYEFYVGLVGPVSLDFIQGLGLEQEFALTDTDAVLEGFLFTDEYEYTQECDEITLECVEVFDNYQEVWFTLTSLSASRVPEPGTLALFSLGLVGFAATRRRKA